MSIIVYYLRHDTHKPEFHAEFQEFVATELSAALTFTQELRRQGFKHVSLSMEDVNSVGKPGVDTIADGKTPDGHAYEWSKQHRTGKMRRK